MDAADPDPAGGRRRPIWSKEFGPFLTLGIQLALTVVACFFIGRWLDGLLGTSPWLMILGLGIGISGGLISFIRTSLAAGRRQDREAAERKRGFPHDH